MKIVIDGDPVCQIRMKFSGRNGIGRIYDPREKQKKQIKGIVQKQFNDIPVDNRIVFEHPRISFVFHMPIPKSTPKRLLPLYNSGLLKHEKKPDVDNFIKLYLDCLDGITFVGDQKVILGNCVKLYHPFPKTIIILTETSQTLSHLEVDPLTWYALYGEECGKCSFSEMVSLPDFYTPNYLTPSLSLDSSYPVQSIGISEKVPLAHLAKQSTSLTSFPFR